MFVDLFDDCTLSNSMESLQFIREQINVFSPFTQFSFIWAECKNLLSMQEKNKTLCSNKCKKDEHTHKLENCCHYPTSINEWNKMKMKWILPLLCVGVCKTHKVKVVVSYIVKCYHHRYRLSCVLVSLYFSAEKSSSICRFYFNNIQQSVFGAVNVTLI